jgi:glycine oxidase
MEMDYLIVGAGLAGCVSAWHCASLGYEVALCDDHSSNSSRVAGGILNPITGKRFVLDPSFSSRWAEAQPFYRNLEQTFGVQLFHPRPMWRIFKDEAERARWEKRMAAPELSAYHGPIIESQNFPKEILAPHGGFELTGTGNLDIPAFLQLTYEHFPLIEQRIEGASFPNLIPPYVVGDVNFKHLIFCEGYKGAENPLFTDTEYEHAKGEILLLDIPALSTHHIINKGLWLLPTGEGQWKAGATYEWDDLNDHPSPGGRSELEKRLRETLTCDFTVLDHYAGVRPTSKQRKPVITVHSSEATIGFLNGLGSKGVLQAPAAARELLELMK